MFMSLLYFGAPHTQTCGANTHTKGSPWLMQLFGLITCIRVNTSLEDSAPRWSLMLPSPQVTASYPSHWQANTWTWSKSRALCAHVRFYLICVNFLQRRKVMPSLAQGGRWVCRGSTRVEACACTRVCVFLIFTGNLTGQCACGLERPLFGWLHN